MRGGGIDNDLFEFLIFINSSTRFGVPIFILCSGAMLLLKPVDDIGKFFRRRFSRVVVPFIFFVIVYELYKGTTDISLMLKDFYHKDVMFHLWFVYMILEMYLFVPIISGVIDTFSQQKLNYTFKVWLGISALATFSYAIRDGQLDTQFIVEFVGYFLAGWAIHNQKLNLPRLSGRATFFILCAIVLLIACLTIFYTSPLKMTSYYGLFCEPYSIAVVLGSLLMFKYFREQEDFFRVHYKLSNFISQISTLTYGGYLIHVLILLSLRPFFVNSDTFLAINGVSFLIGHPVMATLFWFMLTVILSLAIIKIFKLIPVLRRFT